MTPPATGPVLRAMGPDDLPRVLDVQETGSVTALAHVFPQTSHPFPRTAILERWSHELDDPGTDCFVIAAAGGDVAGFAATRADEVLHLGTAVSTWGSGLARRAHDELLAHLSTQGFPSAHLWVFEANEHARHFYEHRGWTPDGRRTTSAFAPRPLLLGYAIDLAR